MNYKKVNTIDYVKEGLLKGTLVPFLAKEDKKVIAFRGKKGERVVTWTTDENDNPIIEKIDKVIFDKETGKTSYILIKVNEDNVPLIDKHGNLNKWVVDDSVFVDSYELIQDNIYKTKGKIKTFVKVTENLIIEQNNEEMKISEGGYINITDVQDMYAISKRDFESSYINVE